MATIYPKTVSDKTVILAPREFILRPFDFGAWTEMRFGIYFGGVLASGDNTASAIETVVLSSSADNVAFGLKDSASNLLPGVAGSLFLGAITDQAHASYCSGGAFDCDTIFSLSAAGYAGVTLIGGNTANQVNPMSYPTVTGATGYNGFYAAKFVITNLGTATQSVAISTVTTSPIAGTDYSAEALRIDLNNATYGTPHAIAWNTGAAARTIPDAVYIRMPFFNNRIRISTMRAIRYAP